MKKSLLFFLLITGFSTMKAQSLYQVKPADSLSNNLYTPFKVTPFTGLNTLKSGLNLNQTFGALNTDLLNFNNMPFSGRMPVAVLEGYSKMPIAKLEGYDKMPMLQLGEVKQGNMEIKALPGLPTFISPAKQN